MSRMLMRLYFRLKAPHKTTLKNRKKLKIFASFCWETTLTSHFNLIFLSYAHILRIQKLR